MLELFIFCKFVNEKQRINNNNNNDNNKGLFKNQEIL